MQPAPDLSILLQDVSSHVEDFVPLPDAERFSNVQISTEARASVIPKTLGTRRKPFDEVRANFKMATVFCLFVCFYHIKGEASWLSSLLFSQIC